MIVSRWAVRVMVGWVLMLTPTMLQAECEWCNVNVVNCAHVYQNQSLYMQGAINECPSPDPLEFLAVHAFDLGREECEGSNPDEDWCNACGYQSSCHTLWDKSGEYDCHEDCLDIIEGLAADLDAAIEKSDAARIASLVISRELAFDAERGVVSILVLCGWSVAGPARTVTLRQSLGTAVVKELQQQLIEAVWSTGVPGHRGTGP